MWYWKYRSRIGAPCTFFTHLLPHGKRGHWIFRDVCFNSWSCGFCFMYLRLPPPQDMESWELTSYCCSCYHCLDSNSFGYGVKPSSFLVFDFISCTYKKQAVPIFCFFCSFACKEISLQYRNARLVAMEAFSIILSVTQLLYVATLYGPSAWKICAWNSFMTSLTFPLLFILLLYGVVKGDSETGWFCYLL